MTERRKAYVEVLMWAALREGQTIGLKVSGQCMWPVLRSGDLLHVQACAPDAIAVGDVVVYRAGSQTIAHRVVGFSRVHGHGFRCQGDTRVWVDASIPPSAILGRVVTAKRRGATITLDRDPIAVALTSIARHAPVLLKVIRSGWLRQGMVAVARSVFALRARMLGA